MYVLLLTCFEAPQLQGSGLTHIFPPALSGKASQCPHLGGLIIAQFEIDKANDLVALH